MQFAILLTGAACSVFPVVDAHFPLPQRRLQTYATGRHCFSLSCGRCALAVAATQVANLRYRSALHQSSTPSMRTFRCRNAGCKPALPVVTSAVFHAVDAHFPLPQRRLQTCATGRHFCSLPCGRCALSTAPTQVTILRYRTRRRLQTCATGRQVSAWLTASGLPAIEWPTV